MLRIGIPRALYYYKYYHFWKCFFQELGFEVVISPKTNQQILHWGVSTAIDGNCLPVKLYYGHVRALLEADIDYLFVPRVISVAKSEYICPKFMGLPDMIKSGFSFLPTILSPVLDGRKAGWSIMQAYLKMGVDFAPLPRVLQAYYRAWQVQTEYEQQKLQAVDAPSDNLLTVAILGHEYLVYDEFASLDIINQLQSRNYRVITMEQVPYQELTIHAKALPKRMFWTSGRKMIGATHYLQPHVDGIISLSAFGCGTDSISVDLIERYCYGRQLPHLNLNLDEHTGEAGLVTRVEAFLDLLARRKMIETNSAAHG